MQVDIRVPVGLPIPEVADFIARCEDAGFDGVGVHDHPHSGRDVYVTLALAAQGTRRIRLYPATMREAVLDLRRLLAGEPVAFGSTPSRLRNLSDRRIPVYLLAAGPRMVELAGEVADGALLLVGLHARAVAAARQHLEAGARPAGRSLSGFHTIFIVPIALEERLEAARRWPQRWFAPGHAWLTYPSASNLYWLRQAALTLPDEPAPEAISDELAARICDAFGLFGPPERCLERLLRAREEAGVEHVFLFPAHTLEGGYDMPVREVEAFARIIRPRVPGTLP